MISKRKKIVVVIAPMPSARSETKNSPTKNKIVPLPYFASLILMPKILNSLPFFLMIFIKIEGIFFRYLQEFTIFFKKTLIFFTKNI